MYALRKLIAYSTFYGQTLPRIGLQSVGNHVDVASGRIQGGMQQLSFDIQRAGHRLGDGAVVASENAVVAAEEIADGTVVASQYASIGAENFGINAAVYAGEKAEHLSYFYV